MIKCDQKMSGNIFFFKFYASIKEVNMLLDVLFFS